MSSPQGPTPCKHTVQPGDTFSALALAYFGDGSDAMAQKIAAANPGVSPTGLQIGQKLQIPTLSPNGSSLDDAYETHIVELVNRERARAGQRPLVVSPCADRHAEEWAVHLASTFQLVHRDLGTLLRSCSARGAAENIAMAPGSSGPEQMMGQWMNSPGHRANILNPNYTHIGVAVVRASNGNLYGTQNFLSF